MIYMLYGRKEIFEMGDMQEHLSQVRGDQPDAVD